MKPRLSSCYGIIACLVLLMSNPSLAQTSGVTAMSEEQILTSQLNTVAVCGYPECDCGPYERVSHQSGPCEATSATGSCQAGSGECCVCQTDSTVAICGHGIDTCNCTDGTQVAKVGAPCTVTSNTGGCHVGSGECCVCTSK